MLIEQGWLDISRCGIILLDGNPDVCPHFLDIALLYGVPDVVHYALPGIVLHQPPCYDFAYTVGNQQLVEVSIWRVNKPACPPCLLQPLSLLDFHNLLHGIHFVLVDRGTHDKAVAPDIAPLPDDGKLYLVRRRGIDFRAGLLHDILREVGDLPVLRIPDAAVKPQLRHVNAPPDDMTFPECRDILVVQHQLHQPDGVHGAERENRLCRYPGVRLPLQLEYVRAHIVVEVYHEAAELLVKLHVPEYADIVEALIALLHRDAPSPELPGDGTQLGIVRGIAAEQLDDICRRDDYLLKLRLPVAVRKLRLQLHQPQVKQPSLVQVELLAGLNQGPGLIN